VHSIGEGGGAKMLTMKKRRWLSLSPERMLPILPQLMLAKFFSKENISIDNNVMPTPL